MRARPETTGTPAPTVDLTVRVAVDLIESVDRLASELDRSRDWIVVEALCRYIAHQRLGLGLTAPRLPTSREES